MCLCGRKLIIQVIRRSVSTCNQICLLLHAYLIKMFTHIPTKQGDPKGRLLNFCPSVRHILEIINKEKKISDLFLISYRNIGLQDLSSCIWSYYIWNIMLQNKIFILWAFAACLQFIKLNKLNCLFVIVINQGVNVFLYAVGDFHSSAGSVIKIMGYWSE